MCPTYLLCRPHTSLTTYHSIKPNCSCSFSEHNVIDAFVKRLRAQLEEVGALGKCDYHATVSKVKWWVRQCCSSWKKEYKERKERKYTLPAITLSDSGEKHS